MSKSNLFRIHPEKKTLQSIKEINYSDFRFRERFDIQEWVESTPEVLGEDLLVIAKEPNYFTGTRDRPDLIALDKSGNIVVIELKRDDAGANTELQAIKYASYFSQFKPEDIVKLFADYLKKKDKLPEADEDRATRTIEEFVTDENLEDINVKQRIILVSHRFPREVVTAVNWLIEKHKMDVKCIAIIPYYDSDKEAHYLQSNEILPVVGVGDLLVKASGETINKDRTSGPFRNDDDVTQFFVTLRDELIKRLDRNLSPEKYSRWAGTGPGYRYYHFWFNSGIWDNWGNSYKVWLFDRTYSNKELGGQFAIFLSMSKKHLLTRGVTEENIKKLITFLKDTKIEGFEFSFENDTINLECHVANREFSEKTRNDIIDKLVILIKATKVYISDLGKEIQG